MVGASRPLSTPTPRVPTCPHGGRRPVSPHLCTCVSVCVPLLSISVVCACVNRADKQVLLLLLLLLRWQQTCSCVGDPDKSTLSSWGRFGQLREKARSMPAPAASCGLWAVAWQQAPPRAWFEHRPAPVSPRRTGGLEGSPSSYTLCLLTSRCCPFLPALTLHLREPRTSGLGTLVRPRLRGMGETNYF